MKYCKSGLEALARIQTSPCNAILLGKSKKYLRNQALELAAKWLGTDVSELDRHPDFYLLENDGATIKKEEVDDMLSFCEIAPQEASRKVVVIDKAHKMNLVSQSALLKILEDRASEVSFVMTSEERLLDTISSRSEVIHFFSPAPEQFDVQPYDVYAYYAAKGDLERYEEITSDEELVNVLHQLPEAVFDRSRVLSLLHMEKEKELSIIDSSEERRDAIISLLEECANRALLFASGVKTKDWESFEMFSGLRSRSIDKILFLVERQKLEIKKGIANKTGMLIFIAGYNGALNESERMAI